VVVFGYKKGKKVKLYRAEFENENIFNVFEAGSDIEAITIASKFEEEEEAICFNLFQIDEKTYDDIKLVF